MGVLRRDADVRDNRVGVTVSDGWVTLAGPVEHIVQWAMADCTARYLPGVRGVINLLHIEKRRTNRDDRPEESGRRPQSMSAASYDSPDQRGAIGDRSTAAPGGGHIAGMAIGEPTSVD